MGGRARASGVGIGAGVGLAWLWKAGWPAGAVVADTAVSTTRVLVTISANVAVAVLLEQ